MCGISGYVGMAGAAAASTLERMTGILKHRGPDADGTWAEHGVGLGNRRLAVLDRSERGGQPMLSRDGRFAMTYNGEVYNYVELKSDLGGTFDSGTDTEVVLEAFARWGPRSFRRLNGMFAFAVWDRKTESLWLVRDRFGVKPLYYVEHDGVLYFASEIKALAAAGVALEPDPATWHAYLQYGLYDHGAATFFRGIRRLAPGHSLQWRRGAITVRRWYDLAATLRAQGPDPRGDDAVADEYFALLIDAVRLRFRSDVPVGVCLSGGLDSSTLVALLKVLFGAGSRIKTYHFACGDARYDETPWVRRLLGDTEYPLSVVPLRAADVPSLTEEATRFQEEPFGGLPTLAMIELFKQARTDGTIVLLDGQGLDEQWAGYGYYASPLASPSAPLPLQGSVNGASSACLSAEFASAYAPPELPRPFEDPLLSLRYRDLRYTKLPRALRFNDRASAQVSCELREPFLDYRLVELAMRQPASRLIRDGRHKYLLRRIVTSLLPRDFAEAPKRAVQTPQREWLRGPLREWVESCIADTALRESGWFDMPTLHRAWQDYVTGQLDHSFHIWQWISVVLNHRLIQSTAPVSSGLR